MPPPPGAPWQLLSPKSLVLPAKAGQVAPELPAWVLHQTVKTRGIPPYKKHGSPPFALPHCEPEHPCLPTLYHAQPGTSLWRKVKKTGKHHFSRVTEGKAAGIWCLSPDIPSCLLMSTCLSSPFSPCFPAAGRSGRDGKPTARCTSKAGEQNLQEAAAGPGLSATCPQLGTGRGHHSDVPLSLAISRAISGIQQVPEEAPRPDTSRG